MTRSGSDLALLLLGGFRVLAERGTEELAARGFADVRPSHDFALRSIASGAENASELARRMSVSKQAAAKTITALEERGYIERTNDAADRRRMRLQVTERGVALMGEGEHVFDGLRAQWEKQIGVRQVRNIEKSLRNLVGSRGIRFEATDGAASELFNEEG